MVDIAKVLGFQAAERKKNSKARIRDGRGRGSGSGKTCRKGGKGQTARAGKNKYGIGFEGGQTPLYRRMPIHGFTNFTRKTYKALNFETIMHYITKGDLTENIKISDLISLGIIKKYEIVKLLSVGEVGKAFSIEVNAASKVAIEKLEKAGGKAIIISGNVSDLEVASEKKVEISEKPVKKIKKVAVEATEEETETPVKKTRAKKVTTEENA
jgi:large subunit ribosomal protein L15